MDLSKLKINLFGSIKKYKYIFLVLCIGIVLILLPMDTNSQPEKQNSLEKEKEHISASELSNILSNIQGAGRVEVLLSIESSSKNAYQTDQDGSGSGRNTTVTITDSERNETGLIQNTYGPVYRGAIVVCEGADHPEIQLSIKTAVSNITGLRSDQISVLKMK